MRKVMKKQNVEKRDDLFLICKFNGISILQSISLESLHSGVFK